MNKEDDLYKFVEKSNKDNRYIIYTCPFGHNAWYRFGDQSFYLKVGDQLVVGDDGRLEFL